VCIDEMTGIQALERKYPDQPIQVSERKEFEYLRHGTQTADPPGGRLQESGGCALIASFDVARGAVIQGSVGATRTEADYLEHVKQTVATDPQAKWHLVMDCLNTHQSESLVRYVAEVEGLTWIWVLKANGDSQSMQTRSTFLSDPTHRNCVSLHAQHCSWLNQVEIWFSILVRKLLRRASFTSLANLKMRILEFIDYFNRTMAKPFQWTYKGKALSR